MDNCSCSNVNNCSDPDPASCQLELAGPGFGAFLVVLLAFICASIVLNISTVVSLCAARSVAKLVRIFLINHLAAGLLSALILVGFCVLSLVLNFSSSECHPDVCTVLSFANVVNYVTRLWSLAAFSLVVLLMVKYGKRSFKTVNTALFIVSIWTLGVFLSVHILVPALYAPALYDGVVCIALSEHDRIIPVAKYFFTSLELFAGGAVPLIVSTIAPIVVLCYVKHNSTSESSRDYYRGLVKLVIFLVTGNGLSFVCHIIVGTLIHMQSVIPLYLFFFFGLLILFPAPILIIVYVKPVRKLILSVLCRCRCCRQRVRVVQMSKKSFEIPLVTHPNNSV